MNEVHIHSTDVHICVTYKVFNTDMSGVIDISVLKKEYKYG